MLETLLNRRSVRAYTREPVDEKTLNAILEAGLYAPSAMNRQMTVLVAVRDKDTRDTLSRMNAQVLGTKSDPFYGAPCVVVVLSDPANPCWVEDGSLVMGNLLNAAQELGLGGCWIHRAREMFESEEGKALLKKWGLPETLRGIGNCILGHPAENPAPRKRLPGRVVHIE